MITSGDCQICGKHFSRNQNCKAKFCSWACLCVHRKLNSPRGDKSHVYLGEDGGYAAKHWWVESRLGKPMFCYLCGDDRPGTKKFHWANLSEKYKRDLDDWVRLCHSCHRKFDMGSIALKINGVIWKRAFKIPKNGVHSEVVGNYTRHRYRFYINGKKHMGKSKSSFEVAKKDLIKTLENLEIQIFEISKR